MVATRSTNMPPDPILSYLGIKQCLLLSSQFRLQSINLVFDPPVILLPLLGLNLPDNRVVGDLIQVILADLQQLGLLQLLFLEPPEICRHFLLLFLIKQAKPALLLDMPSETASHCLQLNVSLQVLLDARLPRVH